MKLLLLLSALSMAFTPSHATEFTYNGFSPSPDFTLDGLAHITPAGLIQLTNDTTFMTAHAFYSRPINFKNSPSFSTSFAFAMVPLFATKGGHGMAFVISPANNLPGGAAGQFMGLMNETTNGNSSNHIFAVEFDVIQTRKFHDLSDDHVGIDVNGMVSAAARVAGYSDENGAFRNLTLLSGNPILAWIDYGGPDKKKINVTLAPFGVPKPRTPLLTLPYDNVSSVFDNGEMFVGFSAATGPELTSNFYVLGWSFSSTGRAPEFDVSQLPKVPRLGRKKKPAFLTSGLPIICVVLVVILGLAVVKVVQRKRKFEDVLEDWEHVYGSHRFKYKDLYLATKGFREREILGIGGLGIVYRGVLPETQLQVAIKRVYYESREGVQEFVSAAVTAGRLRHRNLVPFLGYCWQKSELFLVYEYMPNGSLDAFLYQRPNNTLNWAQRFAVIKGIAAALLYLHEEWDQATNIPREINAGNIFLDGEFNGKIGGFSLARLYDGKRRRVVGTLGYLAPELARSSKATKSSEVYAFGALVLEMACGKMALEARNMADEDFILVDWVFSRWINGDILQAMDPNLGNGYEKSEVEMVLKLGLLCTHSESRARPSMRRVVQYLGGGLELPELSSTNFRIMA
nr:L-type lectin-domain containing receptor kinase IV.1-like [Ipomoea batatas]